MAATKKKKATKRKPSVKKRKAATVTTLAALARALGVHAATAQRWRKKDGFPVERDGSFDPGRVAPWVDEMRSAKANRSDLAIDKGTGQAIKLTGQRAVADLEFKRLKNDALRRRNATEMGELVSRAEVEEMLTNRAAELRRNLLNVLPRAVTRDGKIRDRIRAEVREFLQTYSRAPEL